MTTNEVYYRDLPAIPEDERTTEPSMMSQTFLAHFANCPRSAHLLRKYKGGAPSAAMIRGSLFHETVEELTTLMLINGESSVPPELARDVMGDVLARHPEWIIPPQEVDAVRLMVYHWSENTMIDPEMVFGVEQMWHHELGDGTVIRGKVDLLLMVPGMSRNRDYKTSLAMKSQQDWEADFQSIFYDVLLAYGETEDGVKLGPEIEMFESSVIYPRYVFDDGLGQRTSYRDRIDLRDHYAYMNDLVKKVHEAFGTGKFPAIPGDHCDRCPAALECPLPAQLRDGKGDLESEEEARAAAEDRDFHQSASRRLSKSLRTWVDEHGPLEYGKNREIAIDSTESRSVDWDTLPDAINRAVELGEPFVPEQHVQHKKGTRLTSRKREPVVETD